LTNEFNAAAVIISSSTASVVSILKMAGVATAAVLPEAAWFVEHADAILHLEQHYNGGRGGCGDDENCSNWRQLFAANHWDDLITHSLRDLRYCHVTNYLLGLYRAHASKHHQQHTAIGTTRFRQALTMQHVKRWMTPESRDTLLTMLHHYNGDFDDDRINVFCRWYCMMHSNLPANLPSKNAQHRQ